MRTSPRSAGRPGTQLLPPAAGTWWLALVATLFAGAQLAFVAPRLGLSWDEVVYVSQVTGHAPAAYFDPARARGVTLLVAPATLLTSSVLAMRVCLAVASGLALFLSLLSWRGLRPGWLLALAGAAFGCLWVAQYYGPQAMPDEWVAFAALAAVGFFLRVVRAFPAPVLGPLAGLAGCLAVAALLRPGDAVLLAAALAGAVLVVRAWRCWQLLAAIGAGLVAGCAEWVIEAYLRFGGPFARLHAAGAEQGGFGLHPGIWAELRALNGPTLCRPCTISYRYPVLSLWWLALPVIVVLGVLAARKAGQLGSSVLAAACGMCLALQYLFLIGYAAPRFLLPAYALLAIPVADGGSWLIRGVRPDARPLTATVLGVALAAQALSQHAVLDHQVKEKAVFFGGYRRLAADLHHLGIRPPCLIKGKQDIPIAYYARCGSAGSVLAHLGYGDRVAILEYAPSQLPAYARGWRAVRLRGGRTAILSLIAYLPPH